MRFAKALPPLLFAAALAVGFYVLTAADPASDQVAEKLNETIVAVNSLPRQPQLVAIGDPPDQQWIGERVLELPEDGAAWQTVLILDDSPLSQHVEKTFATNPRLQSLVKQTKFYPYPADHWWAQKYRAGWPTPCIMVQRPKRAGSNEYQLVYQQFGAGIPADGDRLANDIALMIRDCRPRPTPTPTPSPTPSPTPAPDQTPLVPLTPDEQAKPEEDPLGLLAYGLLAAAGLAGAYLGVKKEFG